MNMQSDLNEQPHLQPPMRPSRRWWVMPLTVIGSVFAGMMLMVVLIVFGIAAIITAASGSMQSGTEGIIEVKEKSILSLDFGSAGVQEYAIQQSLFDEGGKSVALLDVLDALEEAKNDPNIVGVYFKPSGGAGFAKQREIIEALRDFKSSKKFIYAFLPSGNESDYAFAAVADSIFMPQESNIEFNGFGGASPFFKDMFEKIGVQWTVIQREDYKSAGEMYNRTSYSEPARREMHELLDARYQAYIKEVASSRGKSVEHIDAQLKRGLYTADQMKESGLIDGFATDLQMKDYLKKKVYGSESSKEKLHIVNIGDYVRYARAHTADVPVKGKKIAIVYGTGAIRSGKTTPFESGIASGSWVRDLRKAANDDDVKAIILRIDSPGGSVQASDEMYQEILRAKSKKPVYASMSDLAASGGYYMSMACDTIIAHPQTITGSIGVIAAIPNLAKTMTKLGVGIDTVATGPAALFMNPLVALSVSDRQSLESMIDNTYQRFLERVASGRKRTKEQIREVAKGRVWTGEAALNNGLVDVLGGLKTAVAIAKARIGVKPDESVKIVRYPEKEDPIASIIRMIKQEDDEDTEAGDGGDAFTSKATRATLAALAKEFINSQPKEWQVWWRSLPPELREQAEYSLQMALLSREEHILAVLPWMVSQR
jgi:protease-4